MGLLPDDIKNHEKQHNFREEVRKNEKKSCKKATQTKLLKFTKKLLCCHGQVFYWYFTGNKEGENEKV